VSESVTRYVPTYVNKRGERTLMRPTQGRYTFETAEAAQAWISAVIANNDADIISQIWGDKANFAVRPCACWPGHFDPKGVWFDLEESA
jgi:hypothetical protein